MIANAGLSEEFILNTLKKQEEAKTAAVVNKYMQNPPFRRQALYKFEDEKKDMIQ